MPGRVAHGPLEGVKVLELGQYAAAPYATQLLSDWGAEVLKVEPLSGDGLRSWSPAVPAGLEGSAGLSWNFALLNRNKRSLVLDLGSEDGRRRCLELMCCSDLVVENLRPGRLAELGLGYREVSQRQGRIVYCSISGYGRSAENAGRAAFDMAIQAAAGLMSVTGSEGGEPAKCGIPVSDFLTGAVAAAAMVSLLVGARRSGRGGYVECTLFGTLLSASTLQLSELWGKGVVPVARGTAHAATAPYEAFRASDGWIVVAAGNQSLWHRLCRSLGARELEEDERFGSVESRLEHRKELTGALQGILCNWTCEQLMSVLKAAGVPCSPVNDYVRALADPAVSAEELVQEMRLTNGFTCKVVGPPAHVLGVTRSVRRPAPALGEGGEEAALEWLSARGEIA